MSPLERDTAAWRGVIAECITSGEVTLDDLWAGALHGDIPDPALLLAVHQAREQLILAHRAAVRAAAGRDAVERHPRVMRARLRVRVLAGLGSSAELYGKEALAPARKLLREHGLRQNNDSRLRAEIRKARALKFQ